MSGRSGYRKTDRKRNRFARPRPPKDDYVLRFPLPKLLSFALAPGGYGWGVTIGFNDIVFVSGTTPAHCCQLAADFLDKVGARRFPQGIAAQIVKLLPCWGHCPPINRQLLGYSLPEQFRPIGSAIDLEAIHDRVSRFGDRARPCAIDIKADAIAFTGGEGWRGIVHDYADERSSNRIRA